MNDIVDRRGTGHEKTMHNSYYDCQIYAHMIRHYINLYRTTTNPSSSTTAESIAFRLWTDRPKVRMAIQDAWEYHYHPNVHNCSSIQFIDSVNESSMELKSHPKWMIMLILDGRSYPGRIIDVPWRVLLVVQTSTSLKQHNHVLDEINIKIPTRQGVQLLKHTTVVQDVHLSLVVQDLPDLGVDKNKYKLEDQMKWFLSTSAHVFIQRQCLSAVALDSSFERILGISNNASMPLQYILFRLRLFGFHPSALFKNGRTDGPASTLLKKIRFLPSSSERQQVFRELHQMKQWTASRNNVGFKTFWQELERLVHENQIPRSSTPELHLPRSTTTTEQREDSMSRWAETNVPLSKSKLWQEQKQFYQKLGIQAWDQNIVPFGISSNAFIAKAYAEMAMDFMLKTWTQLQQTPMVSPHREWYVIEAGSGSCQFGYLFLRHFQHLCQNVYRFEEITGIHPLVILTDFNAHVVESQRQLSCFRPYANDVDFAVWDFSSTSPVASFLSFTLLNSNRRVDCAKSPVFSIVNYFFDSLPADVFVLKNQHLYSTSARYQSTSCTRIDASTLEIHIDQDLGTLSDAGIPSVYNHDDGRLEQVFQDLLLTLNWTLDQLIVFPVDAISFLSTLASLSTFETPIGFLCGDASFYRHDFKLSWQHPGDAEQVLLPELSPDASCFCLAVDMDLLQRVMPSIFSHASRLEVRRSSQSRASFEILALQSDVSSGMLAFDLAFGPLGISDVELFTGSLELQQRRSSSRDNVLKDLTWSHCVSICHFTAWDYSVFCWLRYSLVTKVSHARERRELLEIGHTCFRNAFCLVESQWTKVRLEMARWYYVLGAFDKIEELYLGHPTEDVPTCYLLAMAFVHQNKPDQATTYFRQCHESTAARRKKYTKRLPAEVK